MSGTLNTFYNNVNFALHLNTEALVRLQEQAATGSRINRASDDPSTAYRILGLNSQQMSFENYIDNLTAASSILEFSSTVIEDISSTLTKVRTNLTQIISGIHSEESRNRVAEGINDLLEQMVSLANTQHTGEYLFGGGNPTSPPYLVERTSGEITRVTYRGSCENRNIEAAPGVKSSAFHVGHDIFHADDRGEPIFLGDIGAKAGTGTSNARGHIWLTVSEPEETSTEVKYTLSIDDGLSTFNTNGTDTNLAVTHSGTGDILYIDTTQINHTGAELVSVPGTYDIFNTLIMIRDVLKNERGFSEAQLRELLNDSLVSLEGVSELMVQAQVSVGSKIGFLDDLHYSLKNLKYNAEDEITLLQEADIAQIAIDLSRREILYEMSLSVAGKLLSLSLFNFL